MLWAQVWHQRGLAQAEIRASKSASKEEAARYKAEKRLCENKEVYGLIDQLEQTDRAVDMIMGREVKKVPEEETYENGKPVLNVVTLQLDEKHQGRIRTRGTMRHFAIDFAEEKIRSYMTILLSTPTPKGEQPTVEMYVSYKQVPNQHTFDVRLTGPA